MTENTTEGSKTRPRSPMGVPVEILLVEDNPGDVRLTQEALEEGHVSNTLHVATNGEEALDFLHQRGEHEDAARPDLVLLDLNLPRVSGHQVLEDVKNDEALRDIPVIILTTSDRDEDVRRSYRNHANSFITKPVDFDKFLEVVQSIEGYWLAIVRLPGSGSEDPEPAS